MNPYVPPTPEVGAPKRAAQNIFWTRAFVTATIVRLALIAVLFAITALSPKVDTGVANVLAEIGQWGSTATQVMFFASLVCAGRWLTSMWEALPREDWKVVSIPITPFSAVAFLCIPFINYFWMFAMNLALCDRYESRAYGPFRKETDLSGRGLVLSAGCLSLLGLVGVLAAGSPLGVLQYAVTVAAPLFWIFYMRHLDTLRSRLEG
ncbi:hypothetical protein LZC95_00335 [Pendulispora brunnea]|uniref:DUF4328 domain-containing protein n=1 Tax=Pendulispora brunnea TaxID=2905690 RepID=A0ABZ2KCU0_9BACT